MLKRIIPLLILAVGVAGFILLKVTRPEPDTVSAKERSWLIEVMTVRPDTHTPVLSLYGELVAPEQTTIAAPLAGRIGSRPVQEGQRVKAGELLVALDSADVTPLVDQAEADVNDLRAQIASEQVRHANDREALAGEKAILENARRQFERTQSLVGRNLSSQETLDAAADVLARARLTVTARQRAVDEHPSRLQSLEARLARAQAALTSARRDAERATVAAPFDGIVTAIQVAEGDRVSQNAPLLSVYPDQGLELRARVADVFRQELLDAVNAGEDLQAATGDGRHRFTLSRFAGTSDPAGTEAILTLNGDTGGLRPGGLLPVTLERPPRQDSIAIPYSALYGSDSVYRMTDDYRMQRVTVKRLGEARASNGERQVLVSAEGLDAGDTLIITHLPNAMTGLKVELAGAEPEAGE
ncbi:efflux RND transporter periplasmic adaptor subunit [Marinobacter orientalis]|uniref:Biotin/lipoyl-binding protein n=1 Tax=Marinobacter orientalis TaxID=1928859 RepID=A0A7Y0NKA2_9GAMM|nr:HlyD family efflux transporter periplasmic adaptor subunit [Marinobacter orientalis]NMT63005.1 biotin/lipoyl-binding protein [Marinobacter orientalis]TGX51670.1 biotin/lipoyl-binding protein [Marinobacter orientalis]